MVNEPKLRTRLVPLFSSSNLDIPSFFDYVWVVKLVEVYSFVRSATLSTRHKQNFWLHMTSTCVIALTCPRTF